MLTVELTVAGVTCIALNGGPAFKHSEAFSFQILTEHQAETDRYWGAIVGNGGVESACGCCKDKWGLSWQITPRILLEAISGPDRAASKRAFEAMMKMKKIDIATIQASVRTTHHQLPQKSRNHMAVRIAAIIFEKPGGRDFEPGGLATCQISRAEQVAIMGSYLSRLVK